MSMYNDFFIRPNLTTPEGEVPTTGALCHSPDIIPSGQIPHPDPQYYFAKPEKWGVDLGQPIISTMQNYIYLRAKNFAVGANKGMVYLYYSPSNIINWPSNWIGNQIPGYYSSSYSTDLSAHSNQEIAVIKNPFLWIPNTPPPGSSHYGLIARVVTDAHINPLPDHTHGTYKDMVQLIHDTPGYGWRNVQFIDANAPNWTYQTMLTVPKTATTEKLHIYLACDNIPVGADIAFTCSTLENTSAPLQLARTRVTAPNMIAGVTVTLKPGFSGSIGVSYWANGTTIQGMGGVHLEAALETDKATAIARYSTPAFQQRLKSARGITPILPVYLGCNTFKMVYY